jgi:hypothetical protein
MHRANVHGNGEYMPLGNSIEQNSPLTTAVLLDCGADPLLDLADGYAAYHMAVYWNAHECLELLLDRRIPSTTTIFEKWTMLHVAGRQADLRTISILATKLPKMLETGFELDVRACDHWNRTAREVFESAPLGDPKIAAAFDRLLGSLDSVLEYLSSDDESLYEDALDEKHSSIIINEVIEGGVIPA